MNNESRGFVYGDLKAKRRRTIICDSEVEEADESSIHVNARSMPSIFQDNNSSAVSFIDSNNNSSNNNNNNNNNVNNNNAIVQYPAPIFNFYYGSGPCGHNNSNNNNG
jgi:hypothetical protein